MLHNILPAPEHSRQVFQETIKLLKHKSLYFCIVQLIFDQYSLYYIVVFGLRKRSALQWPKSEIPSWYSESAILKIQKLPSLKHLRIFWLKIFWPDLKFDNKSLIKRWNSCLIIEIMFWSFIWYQSLSNCSCDKRRKTNRISEKRFWYRQN